MQAEYFTREQSNNTFFCPRVKVTRGDKDTIMHCSDFDVGPAGITSIPPFAEMHDAPTTPIGLLAGA